MVLDYIHLYGSRLHARHLRNYRPADERILTINGKQIITYTIITAPEKLRIIAAHHLRRPLSQKPYVSEVIVVGRIRREKYKVLHLSELKVTAVNYLTDEFSVQEINNIVNVIATKYRVQRQIVRVLKPMSSPNS
jgi:hypothetical protein